MKTNPLEENLVCFFCDYGLFVLAVFIVLWIGLWRYQNSVIVQAGAPLVPVITVAPLATLTTTPVSPVPSTLVPTANSSLSVPQESTQTPEPTHPVPTATLTSRPSFVLVFIPLQWQGSRASFEQSAQEQARVFIQQSGITQFFDAISTTTSSGLSNQNLSDTTLVDVIVNYGFDNYGKADRYIGLTDGDLSPEGMSSIAGWTAGEQGMVVESQDVIITAHELGHTFGLCDEYSYGEWSRQNTELTNGCPNPYPPNCPTDQPDRANCDGNPTADGRVSIMGPAGLAGDHGYNQACLDHLKQVFQTLAVQPQGTP